MAQKYKMFLNNIMRDEGICLRCFLYLCSHWKLTQHIMLISIILPVYNVANYIERSLTAALEQTYPFLEIILIDDGSTDESMEIVYQVLQSHPRRDAVKIFTHTNNKGPSAGRNTGLKEASGEYVFFLDNDDSIFPDSIEKLANVIEKYRPQCVIGDYEIHPAEAFKKLPLLVNEGFYNNPTQISEIYFDRKIYIMVWNKLYDRNFLLKNKLFFEEGLIHEDELWSFQLFSILQSVYIVRQTTYIYEIRSNSIMGTLAKTSFNHRIRITAEMSKWIENHPKIERTLALQHFFEDWKNKLLRSIFRAEISSNNKNRFYESIRATHYINISVSDLKVGSFKQRLRLIHYLLNNKMGYRLQRFLLK